MVRLRLSYGMRRRTEREQFTEHNKQMAEALQKQLESGQSTSYGKTLSYQYLHWMGIPVARNRMQEVLRVVDTAGVQERTFGLQQLPKGSYHAHGPNFVWCVDGHHKLSMYGIEIYAAIDAYSR